MYNLRAFLVALTALLLGGTAFGCASSCPTIRSEWAARPQGQVAQKMQDEPVLVTSLHTAAINDLLSEGRNKLLSRKRSESLKVGSGTVKGTLDLNKVEVRATAACEGCVELDLGGAVELTVKAAGVNVLSTRKRTSLTGSVPLLISRSQGKSTLSIDMAKFDVQQIDLPLSGVPSWAKSVVKDVVQDAASYLLKRYVGKVKIASWDALALPGSPVRFQATGVEVDARRQVLHVLWASNLAKGTRVVARPKPSKEQRVGLAISPHALTGVVNGLMTAGKIPSRYNDNFQKDQDGDYHLTLEHISPKADGVATTFTVWSLPASGSCFAAEVQGVADFGNIQNGKIKLSIDELEVLGTRGDDTLFKVGYWLKTAFLDDALQAQTSLLGAADVRFGPLGERQLAVQSIESSKGDFVVYGGLENK